MMQVKMAAEIDKEGMRLLRFDLLNLKINEKDKLVSSELKVPSKLSSRHDSKEQGKNAMVVLELKLDNTDGLHCAEIMLKIVHPNILNARTIMNGESHLLLWVEPCTGVLLDYIEKIMGPGPRTHWTPLPKIVRQIIDGLEPLMVKGYYHGNFNLMDTCYQQRGGETTVKLRNFKLISGMMSLCQWKDLVALGTELKTLSSIADKINRAYKRQVYDSTLLDNLAQKLKHVNRQNLDRTYVKIKRHVFFWETYHRKKFFVYYVPLKMKTKGFKSKVNQCEALKNILAGNHNSYDGFLDLMNRYRAKDSRRAYNLSKPSDFVSFICGLYTHEHEPDLFNDGKKVDDSVMKYHPYLCLILSDLLESWEEDWL